MEFKFRWRDVLAVAATAHLAHVALRGSNVSSASPSLMAFAEFEAFFQHPTLPLNIPLAGPDLVRDQYGNVEGLIVPGIIHKDKGSIGTWKYVDLKYALRNVGGTFTSYERNNPTYLKSDTTIFNKDHFNVIAVKLLVENDETSDTSRVGTIWSDGSVTFHTLEDSSHSKSMEQKWKINLISEHNFGRNSKNMDKKIDVLDYHEVALTFARIPLHDENSNGVEHRNVIIIGASVAPLTDPGINVEDDSDSSSSHFSYFALDVNDGSLVWKHTEQFMIKSTTKHQRFQHEQTIHYYQQYRNDITSLHGVEDNEDTEDCMHHFRVSTLNALPHFWKNRDDTKLSLAHFERNQRAHRKSPQKLKTLAPNVLVSHNRKGIEVISLTSGSPICHLSLLEGVYYDDIQGDGRIDHIHVIREHDSEPAGEIHWTAELLESFRAVHDGVSKLSRDSFTKLPSCQVVAFSGIPARENLYNKPLCHRKKKYAIQETRAFGGQKQPFIGKVDFAPPYSVGNGDFIFGINTGILTRISSDGKYIFQTKNTPNWNENKITSSAMVGLISSKRSIDPNHQPIIVSSESKVMVVSAHGTKLGESVYPEESVRRPILTDLNGDGTTDLLAVSNNGIWIFQIRFKSGSNWLIAINGSLFILLFVSLLVNRSSGHDKRSTDVE